MKGIRVTFVTFLFSFFLNYSLSANGVGVINASTGEYLRLISSSVEVNVESQIAVVKTTQIFKNTSQTAKLFKYAFPLGEQASASGLRWQINGEWHQAVISPTPQDSSLPGGGEYTDPNLVTYLGPVPLYFGIADSLLPDSSVTFELTYVELLPYAFGKVKFAYPNDYSLIQTAALDMQQLSFILNSPRTIDDIGLIDITPYNKTITPNRAEISFNLAQSSAVQDYKIVYTLSSQELGLFSYSIFEADTLVPDDWGSGFFTFIAEPDASQNTEVIKKVFTLIIDRSGSMSGDKIVQAKNAALFIVNHLNDGDMFNIIDFESSVSSFREGHVPFNSATQQAAVSYINQISAGGGTNISGAFDKAVPQFSSAADSTANIIIFFTDGEATAGITHTPDLVAHINNLINQNQSGILLFTFGIGNYVNSQLLTMLADQNNGIAQFLGNDELEEVITGFYMQIRNPVLLNTVISFKPEVLYEVYPQDLPNLYKGKQLIVTGRYSSPSPVEVKLSGEAFGLPVEYSYNLTLSDSSATQNKFLLKLWAKQKIEQLMIRYYLLDSGSSEAEAIKDSITSISMAYGVITKFTSFDNPVTSVEETDIVERADMPDGYHLLGNYPNPFNPSTKIKFYTGNSAPDIAVIKIYNSLGKLVRELTVNVNGKGYYEIVWDGRDAAGQQVSSGIYIYTLSVGNAVLSNKMILMK